MMFTLDQGQELIDNTTSEWVTINNVNGRKFYKYNDPSKYVFLPVAGHWYNTDLNYFNDMGFYWTVGKFGCQYQVNAWALQVHSSSWTWNEPNGFTRCFGQSIRPVAPKRPW